MSAQGSVRSGITGHSENAVEGLVALSVFWDLCGCRHAGWTNPIYVWAAELWHLGQDPGAWFGQPSWAATEEQPWKQEPALLSL